MFNWFRKKNKKSESEKQFNQSGEYSFKWYDLGPENPFNKRILDIRSYTGTMIATTSDSKIAEKFNELRSSIGQEYVGLTIQDSIITKTNLQYPHNGTELEGAAFKADSMDCKWDIYVYDNYFFFTRSWTGDLIYKVKANVLSDIIILKEISHPKTIEGNDAVNSVHFLMKSHAAGQPFPHNVPSELKDEQQIAAWSFSQFGNRACYATYDDITDTIIKLKE